MIAAGALVLASVLPKRTTLAALMFVNGTRAILTDGRTFTYLWTAVFLPAKWAQLD